MISLVFLGDFFGFLEVSFVFLSGFLHIFSTSQTESCCFWLKSSPSLRGLFIVYNASDPLRPSNRVLFGSQH